MLEATKGVDQRYMKGVTNDGFLFGSWFYLKKSGEAVMGVVEDMIGMVKTNKNDFAWRQLRILQNIT